MANFNIPPDFITLCMGIKESYPKSGLFENSEAVSFWYKMLCDIPLSEITDAVARHISTSKFPPTIAEIRELAVKKGKIEKDYSFGFGLLQKAISKFGFYREHEAMEWLRSQDTTTAITVERLGFQRLCQSDNLVADRSHFKSMYENIQKTMRYEGQLPNRLKSRQDQKKLDQNKKALDYYISQIG